MSDRETLKVGTAAEPWRRHCTGGAFLSMAIMAIIQPRDPHVACLDADWDVGAYAILR